jgi:adenylate kinase
LGATVLLNWIALTGTPGTGKTSVSRFLARRHLVVEVASPVSTRFRNRRTVTVNLRELSRTLRRRRVRGPPAVLVGHLAHLLPIRDVFILRCHPLELERRLRRRGTGPRVIEDNMVVEATDFILLEVLRDRRRAWEIDTTGRRALAVAREIERDLDRRIAPHHGSIRWLEDPRVAERLIRAK